MAWAKKHGTPYVEDPVFVQNFMADLSRALGIEPPLRVDEVDFGPAVGIVLRERAAREALTKEERKALAAQRKAQREAMKEKYGYAIVNGQRVEISGYVVEPSGIFMGRGQHPLRGRWKEGATERDITLNLSPDAPVPPGNWREIVWKPESLWIARWEDKLSGKLKYIWISDTAPIKQKREAEKFDKAIELDAVLEQVRSKIRENLTSPNPRRKMVATACYLIDALCLRVGDEKDEDEADTVGATTLRPEHVILHDDGKTAEFKFLGKDSVEWHKTLDLPPVVYRNLQELIENARPSNGNSDKPQIFPLITSRSVNRFLSSVMPGLTAKVFRTHHATEAVRRSLEASDVGPQDPEYVKWEAVARANLVAAELCNHTKQVPANWAERRARMEERERKYQERVRLYEAQLQERLAEQRALLQERQARIADSPVEEKRAKITAAYEKKIAQARRRLEAAQRQHERAVAALHKAQQQVERYAAQLQEREARLSALRQERDAKLAGCTTERQRQRALASYEKKIARATQLVQTAQARLEGGRALLARRQARADHWSAQLQERAARLEALPQEREAKLADHTPEKWRAQVMARYEKKVARAQRRVELAQQRLDRARAALGKLRVQMRIGQERSAWNLGTSLKSYIDPRVYHRWGQQVNYDVLERYYPKTLRRKFAWARGQDAAPGDGAQGDA